MEENIFECTLDDKGRIVIPASLRDAYSGELMITRGRDKCLWIMTDESFQKFKETIDSASSELSKRKKLILMHKFIAPSFLENMQKSGRIVIPALLRAYAQLSKDCIIHSSNDRLELWDAETYRML